MIPIDLYQLLGAELITIGILFLAFAWNLRSVKRRQERELADQRKSIAALYGEVPHAPAVEGESTMPLVRGLNGTLGVADTCKVKVVAGPTRHETLAAIQQAISASERRSPFAKANTMNPTNVSIALSALPLALNCAVVFLIWRGKR